MCPTGVKARVGALGDPDRHPDRIPSHRRLVFGDDRSAAADTVWLWIARHPWPGWRVSVVTAQPPPLLRPNAWIPPTFRDFTPPVPRQLLPGSRDVTVEHLAAVGDPRVVLDACADATLIAVGPRGHAPLRELYLGSTTEWLTSGNRPMAPLIIVRSPRLTSRVLLCVDGSPHAEAVTAALADLPLIADCRIVVLAVHDGHTDVDLAVARTTSTLHDAGGRGIASQVGNSSTRGETADVRGVIFDAITDVRPDLVALGSRGHGGPTYVFLGSCASAVARHAPCSVLLARASDGFNGRARFTVRPTRGVS